ncbi:MAG: hypothetical protein ACJA2S_005535, partial [Cyclobacteriaceae bacterium]
MELIVFVTQTQFDLLEGLTIFKHITELSNLKVMKVQIRLYFI